MQNIIEVPRVDDPRGSPIAKQALKFPGLFRRHVPSGSTLFQPGEPRQLYRVESGAICNYAPSAGGCYEIIEFVFPGEIIGLGRLAIHASTAKAMVDTAVSVITDAELARALANDNRLFFRIAEAGEREFEYIKSRSLKANGGPALQRVANFLLAIISINAAEGRALLFVAEDVSSGYVAEQLEMSIDTLANALLRLRETGVVGVSNGGLRIVDIAALETMTANA